MKLLLLASAALALGAPGLAQAAEPDAATLDGAMALIDTNRDGVIDRAELGVFLNARAASAEASFREAFDEIDANEDGRIDRSEAGINPALLEYFDAIDSNSDGFVTADELRVAVASAQASAAQ